MSNTGPSDASKLCTPPNRAEERWGHKTATELVPESLFLSSHFGLQVLTS